MTTRKKRGTTCCLGSKHSFFSHAACEIEKQSAPKAKKLEKDTEKTLPKKKRGELFG